MPWRALRTSRGDYLFNPDFSPRLPAALSHREPCRWKDQRYILYRDLSIDMLLERTWVFVVYEFEITAKKIGTPTLSKSSLRYFRQGHQLQRFIEHLCYISLFPNSLIRSKHKSAWLCTPRIYSTREERNVHNMHDCDGREPHTRNMNQIPCSHVGNPIAEHTHVCCTVFSPN